MGRALVLMSRIKLRTNLKLPPAIDPAPTVTGYEYGDGTPIPYP